MAEIDEIVKVDIVATTAFPSAQGFGTPLLLGYHTRFPELYRVYSDFGGVAEDFEPGDTMYMMARAVFSQNPTVTQVIIGRVLTAPTYTKTLTMTSATEGQVVSLNVIDPTTGVNAPISYTIPAASTTTTVATAVAALIDAALPASVTVTPAAAVITLSSTSVGPVHIGAYDNLTIADTTAASAAYLTALQDIQLETDDWYTLHLDATSLAVVEPISDHIETLKKLLFVNNSDTLEPVTPAVSLALAGSGNTRTVMIWSPYSAEFAAEAWAGACLPSNPGSITWANKSLNSVTPWTLTATQRTNLRTNNCNWYSQVATRINMTREGVTVAGEFIDIMHGIDALSADIQLSVLSLLANSAKVPFTAAGLDLVSGTINAALRRFEGTRELTALIAAGTSRVLMPALESISPADKAARRLTNVRFTGTLEGAIHYVQIAGTLSV